MTSVFSFVIVRLMVKRPCIKCVIGPIHERMAVVFKLGGNVTHIQRMSMCCPVISHCIIFAVFTVLLLVCAI